MTDPNQHPDQGEPEQSPEDYTYDLAHEVSGAREAGPDVPEHLHQSTATPAETGGDYSYDEVHDLP